MTVQNSTTVRNAYGAALGTAVGASPKISLYTGAQPANCAASETGTLLVTWTLGSTWESVSGGVLTLSSVPVAGTAVGTGTAAHYRIWDNAVANCHEQGTVTATGGGGDVTIDNTSIATGQTVNITGWTKTYAGA